MKTFSGKNKIVLVENEDGTFNDELVIDENTTVITGSDKAQSFGNQTELRTYIASVNVAKFPPIPTVGEKCEAGKIYSYGKDKVKCLRSHERTKNLPEEVSELWEVIKTKK